MKTRRVIVEVEMDTALSGANLKQYYKNAEWFWDEKVKIHQVTVNVIKNPKPKAKSR